MTLSANPVCAFCPSPKPAAWCAGCSRNQGTTADPFHFTDARLIHPADIIVVGESPVLGRNATAAQLHAPFSDDAGAIVKKTLELVRARSTAYGKLNVASTYVVLCSGADPNKETQTRCAQFLHAGLALSQQPVILAMGLAAVKALGIKAQKLADVQHRVLTGVELHGRKYTVVVTISSKQLVAMPGMYTNFANDVERAFLLTQPAEAQAPQVPLEELTKTYLFPKTLREVEEVSELILNYTEGDKPASEWLISADSETNTKFPHRAKLKVLAVSFAWGPGKAAAIPLFHKDTPYDPEMAVPFVRRILECSKPKTFHNGKFDTKVFERYGWKVKNWIWDSMLAEHALSEDKKGQYGLKALTTVFYPQFAGYADKLHELLSAEEQDSLRDTLHNQAAAAAAALVPVPAKAPGAKKKKIDGGFEKIALDSLLPYAAIDTDITRRLSLQQTERMYAEEVSLQKKKVLEARNTRRVFPIPALCSIPNPTRDLVRTRTVPVAGVLGRMELGGVRVDRPYLSTLQEGLGKAITDAETALLRMAANPALKLNSARDIARVLFDEGYVHPDTGVRTFYPPVTLTKGGQAQTTEKVLKYLIARYKCPFSAKKTVYSKAYKAKNTFCVSVEDLSSEDGFIHTNFNQHGTGTYRLSSNDINLQNIPKKLSGFNIKKMFIPDDDSFVFVNADAKGAEVRILTAYSHDQALIQSLNDGQDTHSFIASKIVEVVRQGSNAAKLLKEMGLDDQYPLTYDDFAARDAHKVTTPAYGEMLDKFRTAVKRVVFGILYGAGPAKIAETIGISKDQAQLIINMLFQMFPSIQRYMEQTRWELSVFGLVETYFAHRRRFSVQGAAKYLKSRAERQAVNFKIQSTSSDIVMDCLQRVEAPLLDVGGRPLLTVHDSLGFQWPKKYLSQLPDFILYHLEQETGRRFPWLPVAFKWDFEIGPSYGEMSPFKQYMDNFIVQEAQDDVKEAYTEEEIRIELADAASS